MHARPNPYVVSGDSHFVPFVATLARWIVAPAGCNAGPTPTPPFCVNCRDLDGGLKGRASRQTVEPMTLPWTPPPGNNVGSDLGLLGLAGFAKRPDYDIMPLLSLARLLSTTHGLGEATD